MNSVLNTVDLTQDFDRLITCDFLARNYINFMNYIIDQRDCHYIMYIIQGHQ